MRKETEAAPPEAAPPVRALFPADVLSFQYAFPKDTDLAYEWSDVWPQEGSAKNILPLALKVRLTVIEKDKSGQAGQSIELEKIIPLYFADGSVIN